MNTAMSKLKSCLGAVGCALALALVLGAVAWAADILTVVEREAAIRKTKRTYGGVVATVKEGEAVTLLEKNEEDAPWIRVEYKGITGWMNDSSVTEDEDVILSTSATATGVRATEQSAAGRGFTPEVEGKYKDQNPDLKPWFAFLDKLEVRKYQDEKIVRFLEEGKLAAGGGS